MVDSGAPVAQKLMDRFSPNISGLVEGRKGLITPLRFLIFQRTLPWQPIKVEKLAFFPDQSTCHTAIQKRIEYRNSNFKRFNRMDFWTLCTILVTFGPESPEFRR